MMAVQLNAWLLFQNAQAHFGQTEIVSKAHDEVHRYTYAEFTRRAHLRYIPLAGGDAAVREPWRSAVGYVGAEAQLAGVPDEGVAADYAASDPGVARLCESWFTSAASAAERELRQRICRSPEDSMLGVLVWLRESAGGAEHYLRGAGLDEQQIERLRLRLLSA